ncbi:hypothetical protein GGR56DRAFT_120831 [Xylariaceae sp. FL0804]|nr:hypothetical protein GGR56DRAFT_120831 [Xylariaceae sp. FL0804]
MMKTLALRADINAAGLALRGVVYLIKDTSHQTPLRPLGSYGHPLHYAALKGQDAMVTFLLSKGGLLPSWSADPAGRPAARRSAPRQVAELANATVGLIAYRYPGGYAIFGAAISITLVVSAAVTGHPPTLFTHHNPSIRPLHPSHSIRLHLRSSSQSILVSTLLYSLTSAPMWMTPNQFQSISLSTACDRAFGVGKVRFPAHFPTSITSLVGHF